MNDADPPPETDLMGGNTISHLISLIAERPVLAASGVILSVLSALFAFAPHATVFALYTHVAAGSLPNISTVTIAVVGFIALTFRWVLIWAAMMASHVLAYSAQRKLRQRIADRMLRAPMHELLQRSSGDIRATVVDDVEALEDGLAHLLPDVIGNSIGLLTIFGIFVYLDWRLALAAIFSVIIGFVFMSLLTRGQSSAISEYFALRAKIQAVTTEYVKALPVLRVFNYDSSATQRINHLIDHFKTVTKTFSIRSSISHTAFLVFITSNILVLAPIGYLLVNRGAVTVSEFAFVLIFSVGFGDACLTFLIGLVQRFGSLGGVMSRIEELLTLPQMPEPTQPQKPLGTEITFNDVSFKYNEQPVLTGLSFSISPGERVALVGPSGSGKSTLVRLIPRFMDVDTGSVTVGGVDVRQIKDADLGSTISFVFQEVFLFSETVRHNIALGNPKATDKDIEEAARRAQAHDFIIDLPHGYDTRLKEGGEGLSLGQKQRLSIARAILKDAPILILDEATAYADPENEARVRAALTELTKGKTVFMIAHRLRSITDVDRIFVLENGKIVQQGHHKDLSVNAGLYRTLWHSQQSEEAA